MKISDFTEIIRAGVDSILPIVVGGVNRKITVSNLKDSMQITGNDVSYESQNNLDSGENVQDALANLASSVDDLARDGVPMADIEASISNYFVENPIEQYSYRITRNTTTGTYTLVDINGNSCGTITPTSTISKNSMAFPTSKAVYEKINVGTGNRVLISDSAGMPTVSSVTTSTLNKIVTDTGWINLAETGRSLGSNFELYDSSVDVQFRKIGQVVYVRGDVTNKSEISASTDTLTIFNLGEGYRPSKAYHFVCQGSGRKAWMCTVYKTGEVTFSRYGGNTLEDCPKGAWLAFNFSFIAV